MIDSLRPATSAGPSGPSPSRTLRCRPSPPVAALTSTSDDYASKVDFWIGAFPDAFLATWTRMSSRVAMIFPPILVSCLSKPRASSSIFVCRLKNTWTGWGLTTDQQGLVGAGTDPIAGRVRYKIVRAELAAVGGQVR